MRVKRTRRFLRVNKTFGSFLHDFNLTRLSDWFRVVTTQKQNVKYQTWPGFCKRTHFRPETRHAFHYPRGTVFKFFSRSSRSPWNRTQTEEPEKYRKIQSSFQGKKEFLPRTPENIRKSFNFNGNRRAPSPLPHNCWKILRNKSWKFKIYFFPPIIFFSSFSKAISFFFCWRRKERWTDCLWAKAVAQAEERSRSRKEVFFLRGTQQSLQVSNETLIQQWFIHVVLPFFFPLPHSHPTPPNPSRRAQKSPCSISPSFSLLI